jgi:hypothetical protein
MTKVFKNIKDGKLYILYNFTHSVHPGTCYVAIPYKHHGKPISHCDIKDFIPVISGI